MLGRDLKGVGDRNCTCVYSVIANCEGSTCHAGKGRYCYGVRWSSSLALSGSLYEPRLQQTFIQQLWKSWSPLRLQLLHVQQIRLETSPQPSSSKKVEGWYFWAVKWCGKKYVSPRITQRSGISIRVVNSESAKLVSQTKATYCYIQ